MEYIKDITIMDAVIHVLDANSWDPILNDYFLELDDDTYGFLFKHIERCLKDDELKYAVFNEDRNLVKEISQEYLNAENNLLDVSKEIARQLFIQMKANVNIPSCDLLTIGITTEFGPMLAILKMDYDKSFTHKIDFKDNKMSIGLIQHNQGLPSNKKIDKAAFIKPIREGQEFNLMVIDKQKRSKDSDEYGTNYFINNYLGCSLITNERDMTKNFLNATETWTRNHIIENADKAETIRTTVKKNLKEEETINVEKLSEELFKEEPDKKVKFVEFVNAQGIKNEVKVDKEWVEKKFKRIRLKIDKDIDLYINEDAYQDNERFEIQRIGDGSINIILKKVKNYIEK